MSGDQSEEKTLPATRRKLRKQREKGNVVTSKETVTSVAGAAALSYLFLRREAIGEKLMALWVIEPDDRGQPFGIVLQSRGAILSDLTLELLVPFFVLLLALSVLLGMIVAGGPNFSVEPLMPKFEKIDPVSGFKRLFSRKAFVSFLMHLVRLALLSGVLGLLLFWGWGPLIRAPVCGLPCVGETLTGVVRPMLIACVVIMIVMAVFDYLVQRAEFLREQRMTLTEFKREIKDQEGDATIKGQRQQIQREMVEMPTGARQAVLIVAGDGGVSFGIRYVEGETPAPLIVAKALNRDSARRLAAASGAPAVRDEALVADMKSLRVGAYVTDDDLVSRLAPHLHRAALARR